MMRGEKHREVTLIYGSFQFPGKMPFSHHLKKFRITDSEVLWDRASLEDFLDENAMPYGIG